MIFYTTTKSLEVSVLKIKNLGREGREAPGMATAEREVKSAKQDQHQCLLAPR